MFGSMQRRREMRRLMRRLESARQRKDDAMEAFVSGKPTSPVHTPYSIWSKRASDQPDANEVADAIETCEQLEAEFEARRLELEEAGEEVPA